MAHQELLSIGAAAAQLGVSIDTLRRWSASGRIPVVVLPSGHRRYSRDDIDALLGRSA